VRLTVNKVTFYSEGTKSMPDLHLDIGDVNVQYLDIKTSMPASYFDIRDSNVYFPLDIRGPNVQSPLWILGFSMHCSY